MNKKSMTVTKYNTYSLCEDAEENFQIEVAGQYIEDLTREDLESIYQIIGKALGMINNLKDE